MRHSLLKRITGLSVRTTGLSGRMTLIRCFANTTENKAQPRVTEQSAPPTPTEPTAATPKKKAGLMATVKELGMPFLVYWLSTWAASGVGLYLVLEGTGVDALAMLEKVNINIDVPEEYAKYGNLAIAVAVNEAAEIVRFPLCVATFKGVYGRYKKWKD